MLNNQANYSNLDDYNIKISIITPTVRSEGLNIVERALNQQTFTDWEWIIISPFIQNIKKMFPVIPANVRLLKEPERQETDVWTLNKAYNKAIREAKGELIVSWQDYTYANPNALEKFWCHYIQEPKTLVTGVGNKYTDETFLIKIWQDSRESSELGIYPCNWNWIEFNFCAVPKEAFYAVGGFDEYIDRFYGMDGYSVVDRLNILGGWNFKIDQTNKTYSLGHTRYDDWEEKNAIHCYDKIKEYRAYLKNPILSYLTIASDISF